MTITLTISLWWIPFIVWAVIAIYHALATHDIDGTFAIIAISFGSMAAARWLP